MKKLAIIAIISVTLTTPSLASDQKKNAAGTVTSKPAAAFNVTRMKNILQKQLDYLKKIHDSIKAEEKGSAGGKKGTAVSTTNSSAKTHDDGLFFLKPQFIYNNRKENELGTKFPSLIQQIKTEEDSFFDLSIDDLREEIDERRQYADIIDRAVDIRFFDENKNNFQNFEFALDHEGRSGDIKSANELLIHLDAIIALMQNEKIKLNIIGHSRDIERALIKQLQYKRTSEILGSTNKQMPNVRSR